MKQRWNMQMLRWSISKWYSIPLKLIPHHKENKQLQCGQSTNKVKVNCSLLWLQWYEYWLTSDCSFHYCINSHYKYLIDKHYSVNKKINKKSDLVELTFGSYHYGAFTNTVYPCLDTPWNMVQLNHKLICQL